MSNLFTTAVLERPASPCSPKPWVVDAQLGYSSPLHITSHFGTSPTQDESLRLTGSCRPGSNTVRGMSYCNLYDVGTNPFSVFSDD